MQEFFEDLRVAAEGVIWVGADQLTPGVFLDIIVEIFLR